jgi:hypothetical protein
MIHRRAGNTHQRRGQDLNPNRCGRGLKKR